jgi:UV DNA damage endonuclease
MPPRIGYACINLRLAEKGIKATRTVILRSAHAGGLAKLQELASANIADLGKIVDYNEERGIKFFRITSNLFPHLGNPKLRVDGYSIDFARNELAEIGRRARSYGQRLTMHPGQYVQLGSPSGDVARQAIVDLTIHASILLAMGLSPSLGSVCVIHGGGRYGEPAAAMNRWRERYLSMPADVRQFIVLENDEHWSADELLPISEELKVPIVVDFFHDTLKPSADIFAIMPRILRVWRARGIPPKCHLSGQAAGKRRGAHSDCIDEIPQKIWQLCCDESIDICLEVKKKDICLEEVVAMLRAAKKLPSHNIK